MLLSDDLVMQEKVLFSRKIYTAGKNFTPLRVVTVSTNLNSGLASLSKMGEWWNNKEWIGIHNGGTIGNGRDFIVLKMADCQSWGSEIFSLIPKNYIRHCN